jgi:hypothetical protein
MKETDEERGRSQKRNDKPLRFNEKFLKIEHTSSFFFFFFLSLERPIAKEKW